ncbi:MAG TPA: phage portal protein, partial [Candidatus Limiplasma sp.]|nr:phage portal protein [Candidatus Limiplasma sp.]
MPDLTNEKFSSDTSGVAMRFKLLGLEQLTKIKERWFREGLRHRLLCMAQFLATKGMAAVDVDAVQITFSRSLP